MPLSAGVPVPVACVSERPSWPPSLPPPTLVYGPRALSKPVVIDSPRGYPTRVDSHTAWLLVLPCPRRGTNGSTGRYPRLTATVVLHHVLWSMARER